MMRSLGRRIALLVAVGASLTTCLWGAAAFGQSYPDRPIKLIVPYPAGGSSDMIGRVIAQKLGELLGQRVLVDNRAGAGGRIGVEATSKAPPDGYTIGLGSLSTLSIAPSIYSKMPYDPIKSFEPISMAVTAPFLIVVNASVPANSLRQLVDLEKSNPGKLNFATVGAGTVLHFFGDNFNTKTGPPMLYSIRYAICAA